MAFADIPNTISLISLTPSAAKNPGINKMIRAKILFIGSSFRKLTIQKIIKHRKDLSRRRIQITINRKKLQSKETLSVKNFS